MENALTLTQTGIGKKAAVALTGAVMFGFVLVHMLGNLQIFLGRETLNHYSAMLHAVPELLWVARAVLLVSVISHIALTVDLAMRNAKARPTAYRVSADVGRQDPLMRYARKTMILSGPIVLSFIVFHLAHLTLGEVPGLAHGQDVYENVVRGFQNPVVAGFYVFANILLGLHLYHGGHSLLQSLGLRNPRLDPKARTAAAAFAAAVTVGNVVMPLAVLVRAVGADVQ